MLHEENPEEEGKERGCCVSTLVAGLFSKFTCVGVGRLFISFVYQVVLMQVED